MVPGEINENEDLFWPWADQFFKLFVRDQNRLLSSLEKVLFLFFELFVSLSGLVFSSDSKYLSFVSI